jgi:hypothetical protein
MYKILNKIWESFPNLLIKKSRINSLSFLRRIVIKSRYIIIYKEYLPLQLKKNYIYIISESGCYWMAAFNCPCECGEIIKLNLLPEAYPRWKIIINNKKQLSIYPSIWRIKGCKSHFIIKKGNVVWIYDKIFK